MLTIVPLVVVIMTVPWKVVDLLEKKIECCPLRESNARPSPYEGDALPLS